MKFDYITEVETETLKTGRTYFTPDGAYPSITTILGKTADNTWLQKWIERVGEKKLQEFLKKQQTAELLFTNMLKDISTVKMCGMI